MHQIVDSLPAMIWTCAPDGHVTQFNKRWLQFTGCSLRQALEGGWAAAIHPSDVGRHRAAHEMALAGHEPFEVEYRLRLADGEYRWILDQASPQFTVHGEFHGFIGVAIDITERKLAENKLRWFSKVVEQSPAAVMVTDLGATIEYVNPRFAEVTGYTFEEAVGRNPRILKSGETPADEYRKMWETLRTGEWRGEFHNKRKNGELYWEAASICPIRDENGTPTHYVAVKEDITERKRLEDALRASEERFRVAVENAQLCVYDIEAATGRSSVIGPGSVLHGLSTLEDWARALHPDDRERLKAAHQRRPQEGLREEYRIVGPDGKIHHYLDFGAPEWDGRWIGVLRNITEEKQAEASLARLAAIVECSTSAIVSFDAQGIIQNWNAAAERLYGYSAAEVVGKPAHMLSPPELHARAQANVALVVGGTHRPAYETRHMRKNGEVFPVNLTASPIRGRDGKVEGGSVIIRDITEQKRVEEALRESENRFRALVQSSSDVITLLDPEGIILYDSPGAAELMGVSPAERQGSEAINWIHPDDRSYVRMLHEELLRAPGAKLRAQIRLRHADGSWRWCDSWAMNLLNEPGVRALVASFRDITELKDVENALRESEERYRRLIEDASDAIFTIDLTGRCTSLNKASEKISGYSREEALGMSLQQVIPAELLPDLEQNVRAAFLGQLLEPVETELIARNGRRVCVEVTGRPQICNGAPVGLLCIARDISQRKRAERLEQNRCEVLEMVAQNQPLPAVLHRLEEMIGQHCPGTAAKITLADEACSDVPQASGGTRRVTVPIQACDGRVLGNIDIRHGGDWKATDFEQILLDSKAKLAAIALEHRQLTDRLAHQAHHDPLTGLPNRILLEDRLRQAITLARRQGTMVAVFYLDLDRFKFINDTLGHDVGDMLLNEAARRLQGALRESDTLARPGGDEFVAVLQGIEAVHDAEAMGQRIVDTMRSPFQVMGHELFASVSVGLSLFPQDGQDAATLQKHADVAMYEAKNAGRNRFQKFAREMNSASHERLQIENHLHRSLERNELQLYYQPQFDLSSGRLNGVEALLRWNHPKWGLVPPNRFVPVAEESGLIIPISLWVLQEACRQHNAWRHAGSPPVRIAVNISATQFARSNLAEKVAEVLAAHDVEPQYLELELTEGVLMRDVEDSKRQIAQLRELGVRISIDDFGTGYSSLSYLQRLSIDDLKIDKCFVHEIGRNSGAQPLVKAIVGLAHGLHLTATAEGVETEAQLAALQALGCDRVQGFLLGRPMPADAWPADWLSSGEGLISDPGLLLDLPA